LLAILLVEAAARLGETEAELAERYGKAEEEMGWGEDKILVFYKAPFRITCTLSKGRVRFITYKKDDDWTDDEIRKVLNKNSGQDVLWSSPKVTGKNDGLFMYEAADGLKMAVYDKTNRMLSINYLSDAIEGVKQKDRESQKSMNAL